MLSDDIVKTQCTANLLINSEYPSLCESPPSASGSINPAGGAFGDGPGVEPGFFRDEGDGAVKYVQSGHVGIP